MNLRQLEFFITLAKIEHMTKTAELLNTTQPNLSHAIKELERELGVPLFEKIGRNIKLTKFGSFFLPYAERSLTELADGQQALDELIDPYSGHLSVGYVYTLGYSKIPKLVQKFKSTEQHQNVTFSLVEGTTEKIIDNLLNGEIDVALCSNWDNPSVEFTPLFEQELVLIVPKNHSLAEKEEVSIEEIIQHPFIQFSAESGLRPFIDKLFVGAGVLESSLELTDDHSIAGFVEAGFGVSVVPNIKTLASFQVKVIKIKDIPFKRYIYLVKRKEKYLSPITLKFVDFLVDSCRDEQSFLS